MSAACYQDTTLCLVKPESLRRARYPALDFNERLHFQTHGERILITDPLYLADVYNVPDGIASEVRQRGIILLPLTLGLSDALKEKVRQVVRGCVEVALRLPAGTWMLYYAQDVPGPFGAALYRGIVVRWEPDETTQPRLPF